MIKEGDGGCVLVRPIDPLVVGGCAGPAHQTTNTLLHAEPTLVSAQI